MGKLCGCVLAWWPPVLRCLECVCVRRVRWCYLFTYAFKSIFLMCATVGGGRNVFGICVCARIYSFLWWGFYSIHSVSLYVLYVYSYIILYDAMKCVYVNVCVPLHELFIVIKFYSYCLFCKYNEIKLHYVHHHLQSIHHAHTHVYILCNIYDNAYIPLKERQRRYYFWAEVSILKYFHNFKLTNLIVQTVVVCVNII